MNDLIRKRDIDYISAPIAPVLKDANVHYEYVAFRKQIEDISPVPAIPISVIEQIRAEIEPKCDRINSLASVLPYTVHREIQELLCEIMDLFEPQESEDKTE